ncbi:Mov34-domain-containing protein [Mycena maculata]|uniref:Mov34-domain-containing protein n=1 Tax=Mycena maculata TaxID=230809 RepID=A0AAD7HEM9_9AGAR|nr:Mov34-domain-containing protein [Mycena maculata]
MSSHQRTQGYVPSAVFQPGSANGAALDAARAAAASTATVAHGPISFASPPPQPVPPRPQDSAASPRAPAQQASLPARRPSLAADPHPRLRTVVLPHATLPRFPAIASVNTVRNMETCGLLLGWEIVKGADTPATRARYVISTLLIPKQHATSDTCAMDEEEGVLSFTEAWGLITIGWIHMHPSQSCFMSSVDLHTHTSFQQMLPESIAVVCAPKSDPDFGIFRLTDPPGLQVVLKCNAKQAFHPHPDVPIYTDADRGHVQMRDAALEIVDLR